MEPDRSGRRRQDKVDSRFETSQTPKLYTPAVKSLDSGLAMIAHSEEFFFTHFAAWWTMLLAATVAL